MCSPPTLSAGRTGRGQSSWSTPSTSILDASAVVMGWGYGAATTARLAHAPTIQNEICWGCFGFSGDNTFSAYYPTAQPDDEGNVTAVFNFSGQYSYPSVGYISKRSTMRPGSFSDSGIILKSGAAFYCQID